MLAKTTEGRENEPAFSLARVREPCHCSLHAEGEPDAEAEGKPEATRCKSR